MAGYLKLAALFLLSGVHAHGGVYNYTIDGISYPGHYPWLPEEGQNTIQRRWWPDPIQDVNHPYLACNRGNPLAKKLPTLHAPVRAGGDIRTWYTAPPCPPTSIRNQPTSPSVDGFQEPTKPMTCAGPEYPWVHSQGPVIIYMADCGGPCDQWDGTGKRWFKIAETQLEPGNDLGSGMYGQREYANPAKGWNVTIPASLKPGNYMIRHEIIMIEIWPPQFYPECAQLVVSGSGDKSPAEEYLVSFPGAYANTDPGIAVSGDIYSQKGHSTFNYTVPGPKVWTGKE